jgi:HSP20 family protein
MKTSDRNSNKRKQKKSFDIFTDNKVENLSREIQNMFESLRLMEMLQEIHRNEFRANNWFDYNYIIKALPVEKPMTQKFESCSLKTTKKSKEDRPPFDIITDDDEVTITIDMPDTKIENIGLWITRDTVEIMPNNPKGKYHRLINLPCHVKSKAATFTYRNGILDIMIKREK